VLGHEGWPFVKAQAVGVLAHAPASHSVDEALAGALRDPSIRVRGAAVVALGERRAASYGDAVRARLDDPREDPDVRAAAAETLGALCYEPATDRLTRLALLLGQPGLNDEEQRIALGALIGLAALKPDDLRQRLVPLTSVRAPPPVRAAAQRALAARSPCR
jgi:hypothetical protein